MPDCIDCGAYTKFENGRCYDCYSKQKNPKFDKGDLNPQNAPDEDDFAIGLSDKQKNYRFNMIKGRIAETLIQELFLSLGYNVFQYGMENTIPGIMELLKGVKSEVAHEIRRIAYFGLTVPPISE